MKNLSSHPKLAEILFREKGAVQSVIENQVAIFKCFLKR